MRCENCNRETEIRVSGADPHCPGCRIACGARTQTIHVEFAGRVFAVDHDNRGVNWRSLRSEVTAMVDGNEAPQTRSWWSRMFGPAREEEE